MPDFNSTNISNQSGGIDIASTNTNIGGDAVGRDKIESAGGHIIHAGLGATVIINEPSTPASQDLPKDPHYYDEAVQAYRQRMRDRYSTTRMLGKAAPVPLEGIFTDVYLLDRPTALQRYDIEQLKARHAEHRLFGNNAKRVNALQLASQEDHLFILGKPGAGKTTFLKYLTLKAATGKLDRVPVFIPLNEWASGSLELLPFIQRQFEISAFPDAATFIQQLLERGGALVCFDGLDEVNEANDKRTTITQAISDFTNQYPANKHLITCRIAATDHIFEKFTYVEMADFTPKQVQVFARKWFARNKAKAQRFAEELNRDEHRGLRELAQTPLLLTLLCLAFEEKLTFPTRRAELYEEALDALLKKWDASRNIKRAEAYRGLSLGRKQQLFTQVAAEYFERGEIFFQQSDLVPRVNAFLKGLPSSEAADDSDGEDVLKAVEAQHGLFVERAHRIYSFSHLTLQEYFMARYIVDHAADGALEHLITQHLTTDRWREVFLLTASMLPPKAADNFFVSFQQALDQLLRSDERLLAYSRWATDKANDYAYLGHPALTRAVARATAAMISTRARDITRDLARERDLDRARDIARDRASDRARDFDRRERDLDPAPMICRLPSDRDRMICRIPSQRERRDRDPMICYIPSQRERELKSELERITLALDPTLDLIRARGRARVHDRALDLDRDFDRARHLNFDRARALDRDFDRLDLNRLDLNRALDRDLAFILVWIFARFKDREGAHQLVAALTQASRDTGQAELAQALNNLYLPAQEASDAEWESYTANLQALLIRYRNIGHEWNFTDDQSRRIDQYELGTVLLAECLKLATVWDREAIENRLLLPPS